MSEPAEGASIGSVWREIEIELEASKDRIFTAIRNYPPPITACDEQFDQLLGEREKISREIDRLKKAAAACLADPDPAARIEQFLRTSSFIDEVARRRIRALTSIR